MDVLPEFKMPELSDQEGWIIHSFTNLESKWADEFHIALVKADAQWQLFKSALRESPDLRDGPPPSAVRLDTGDRPLRFREASTLNPIEPDVAQRSEDESALPCVKNPEWLDAPYEVELYAEYDATNPPVYSVLHSPGRFGRKIRMNGAKVWAVVRER